MHRFLLYSFLLFSLLFGLKCNKDKLKAPKSAFIVVNPVKLKTTLSQGSNSHNITDIWYYVNGKFKGIFPVGNIMPIVAAGNTEITLYAGIKNNGISATRLPYPLFKSVTINQNIVPGETYTYSPEFEYYSSAFFYYAEDFESTGTRFISVGECDYINTSTYDPSKSYGGSGGSIFMPMTDAEPTTMMLQSMPYFLPGEGAIVYVELNYKCNQPFEVGVIDGGGSQRFALTVNKSEEWNKIYIQLTSILSTQPLPNYQLYIKAQKMVDTPEIYVDNIKLIYQ